MSSLKRHEGYLLVDNSQGPGFPDWMLPEKYKNLAGLGQGRQEIGTWTCSHCGTIVVPNHTRTRERGYCRKCDHYVCDNPECNKECRPFKALIDDLQERSTIIIP